MKKLMILFLWLLAFVDANAQDTVYYTFYGTTGEDVFTKSFLVDDSLVLFGSTDNGTNQSDIYVIKTDRNQSGFRSKKIGTSAIEFLVDIDFDSVASKYYALINYYSGFNATEYDYGVVVLDAQFNEINRKVFEIDGFQEGVLIRKIQSEIFVGYQYDDYTKVIALDTSLNTSFEFLATGNSIKDIRQFYDHVYVLSDSATINQQLDICLSKFDLNYNFENALLIGDSLDEIGASLAAFNSGILIAGSSSSFNLPGDFDAIICYIDSNDSLVWIRDHGYAAAGPYLDDFGIEAININDTAILFAVQTNTYGLGKTDFMSYQLSQNGYYYASNSFGTDQTEALTKIHYFSENEVLLIGTSDYQEIGALDYLLVNTKLQIPNEFKVVIVLKDSSQVETVGIQQLKTEVDISVLVQNRQLHIESASNVVEVRFYDFNGRLIISDDEINAEQSVFPIENLTNINLLVIVKTLDSEKVFKLLITE